MNEYTCLAIIAVVVGCALSDNVRDVLQSIIGFIRDVVFGIGNAIRAAFIRIDHM